MSARRLGRLFGATLALVALAALVGGIVSASPTGGMRANEFEWTAKFAPAVVEAP
jgi:hypothetical protein